MVRIIKLFINGEKKSGGWMDEWMDGWVKAVQWIVYNNKKTRTGLMTSQILSH